MTAALGIDVGGTKLAAAIVDAERGTMLAARRAPTDAARGPSAVLDDCLGLAQALTRETSVTAIGVAVCELVGPDGAVRSHETVDWRDVDVTGALAHIAPAVVESDVRAAALAEARCGAGLGVDDFLYVSVGTGISHTLVVDGRPRPGAHGSAISTGAPLVERWSGGRALAERSGHQSAERALADASSSAIVADAAQRLGVVLATLVNALDPGLLIVGGGLGLNERYRDLAVAAMRAAVYDPAARAIPVRAASLGPDAAVVGAALAAFDVHRRRAAVDEA